MQFRKKILIVDDDQKLTEIIEKYFTQYEFQVFILNDATNIIDVIKEKKPDIILLDVMLPNTNGFDVLRNIQKDFDIPVIMLTAKGDEVDKVIGLEMGADDYVTKPFSVRELVARIRTVLRRRSASLQENTSRKELNFDNVSIIPDRRSLRIGDKEMELTRTEFDILYLLASNANKTFSREEILKIVSDRDYAIFDRSIDMHISHLRNKLKEQNTCRIRTVWGSGYRFEVN
ncbi:MAG TPA: response regulator transcription factor [Spirochaetota bacterium]|nr:response regulator transcription factor [Spirochaetota bacterium]HOL56586.1 response regulator transcription factor [Spirochaetota bacterium]HPP04011.1 response regulator transcription factor [Spirochaetota bacterium]